MTSVSHASLLAYVADPDHAILLLLVGILFIYAEFNKPGTVILGCFGALLTMCALYGLAHLPLSLPAITVTIIGVVLVPLSCFFRFRGPIATAGFVSITFGLLNLVTAPRVHPVVAVVTAIIFTLVTSWLARIAFLARQNKVLIGPQAVVGKMATVHTPLTPTGKVEVRGELWPATVGTGAHQPAGALVDVLGVYDLQLLVVPNPAKARSAE